MKKLGLGLVAFLVVGMGLTAVGCGAEVDPSEPTTGDDQEVRAASLVGAWTKERPSSGPPPGAVGLPIPNSGPPPGAMGLPIQNAPPGALGLPNMGGAGAPPPPARVGLPRPTVSPAKINGIVFGRDGRFFADASSLESRRITGTYTVRGSWLTLAPDNAAELEQEIRGAFKDFAGAYRVRATSTQITLTKDDRTLDLYKHDSYCSVAPDCDAQELITIACVGSFTCTPQKTCSFSCGVRR